MADIWTQSTIGENNFTNTPWTDPNFTNTTQPPPLHSSVRTFREAVAWIDYLCVPIVFSLGTIGNTLSFLVFVFSHVRCHSSSIYLAALSITDTGFLFCVFVSWVNNLGVHWHHEPGLCQMFVYLSYVFSFLSVWYVVSFTVERYIAVCFPFKRHTMCTVKRARIVVISLAIFALIAYNFAIWTSEVSVTGSEQRCSVKHQYLSFITLTSGIDSVITLIIPCVIIFILNLRIIYAAVFITKQLRGEVYTFCPSGEEKKKVRGRAEGSSGSGRSVINSCSVRINSGVKVSRNAMLKRNRPSVSIASTAGDGVHSMAQVKVTRMLVVVSSAFLILNLPSHLLRLYAVVASYVVPDYRPSWLLLTLQRLFIYIYYVNFSVNFFLYAACGKNFRQALCRSAAKLGQCVRRGVVCKMVAHKMAHCVSWKERGRDGGGSGGGAGRKGGVKRMRSKTRSTLL